MQNTKIRIKTITQEEIDKAITNERFFAKLLRDNKGFIESIVLKFMKRNDERFDEFYWIGAESFYRALRKFNTKRKDASTLSTYAYKVIFNDLLRQLQDESKIHRSEVSIENFKSHDSEGTTGADYQEATWNINAVSIEDVVVNSVAKEQFMAVFSPLERQIFELKMKRYTMKEIAKKLKKKLPTLRLVYYNAINKPEYQMLFKEIQL